MAGAVLELPLDPTAPYKAAKLPAEVASSYQTLQQQMLNNRLLGMNLSQTQAQREAARLSVDPNTNKQNIDTYMRLLAEKGGSPESLSAAQGQRNAQVDQGIKEAAKIQADLGVSEAQGKFLSAAMLEPLAKFSQKDTQTGQPLAVPTSADLRQAYANAFRAMGPGATQAALDRALASIENAGDDPAKIVESMKGAALIGSPTAETYNLLVGPMAHGGLSASEASAPTPMMTRNPDGSFSPSSVTREQFRDMAQQGPVATAVPLSKEGLPATTQRFNKNTNTMEFVGVGDGGGAAAAPALGVPERTTQGLAYEQGLNGYAAKYQPLRGALKNFDAELDRFASGPKAPLLKTLGAIALQLGGNAPPIVEGVKAQEVAGKTAQQILQLQFQALGGTGTNQQMDSVMHTSPNELMSRAGGHAVAAMLLGNNDAIRAQHEAYQTWIKGHGPQDYGDFIKQWNEHADPRVFQTAYMKPADIANMKKDMSAAERRNFDAFRAFIKKRGWYNGGE